MKKTIAVSLAAVFGGAGCRQIETFPRQRCCEGR